MSVPSATPNPRSTLLWIGAIMLAAVLLRLVFSLVIARQLLHIEPQNEGTDGYHLIAKNLHDGLGYRFTADSPPTMQRPPAYPAFLAAIFAATGVDYVWVQVAQALLGAVSCWILFVFGRWVLSAQLGLTAAALYAVYPISILYSARLYAENLYFPLFLGFAYVLCRASLEGSVRRGIWAGALWGAGLLTRGTLLPLPFMLPVGVFLSMAHRRPARRWIAWGIPALLTGVLVVAPWTMRNYSLVHALVPVSSWGWGPMYHGSQVARQIPAGGDLGKVDAQATRELRALAMQHFGRTSGAVIQTPRDEIEYDHIGKEMTLAVWRDDPVGLVKRSLTGIAYAWYLTFDTGTRLASLVLHFVIFSLFLTGVIQMWRGSRVAFYRAWPALGLIIFVNLFYAIAFPQVRYMAPAVALSTIFAALPLLTLGKRILASRQH